VLEPVVADKIGLRVRAAGIIKERKEAAMDGDENKKF
jgi:hypothetical protein